MTRLSFHRTDAERSGVSRTRRVATAIVGTAAVVVPGGCATQTPKVPEPVPVAPAPPFSRFDRLLEEPPIDAQAYDPLGIFGAELAEPDYPKVTVGDVVLVMTVSGDDVFGKAELVQTLLQRVDSDVLLSAWLDDANLDSSRDVVVDLDALFALADALEARGIRPTFTGLGMFANARGIEAPGRDPSAGFIATVLDASTNDIHLDGVAPPSPAAATTIRFLRDLEDPAAFVASWGLAFTDDGALSAAHAEAIHDVAARRGIDLTGNAEEAAARLRPIGVRPEGEAARFDWYTAIVTSRGLEMRTAPKEMNVVGLRGFDAEHGLNANAFGEWNDTIAFVWRDDGGNPHVIEYRGTTDPGMTRGDAPDVNGDGVGDVAHLRPGQYTYYVGTHKGRPGGGNPTENVTVDRDTNHDGAIDDQERAASLARDDRGFGINIHWGPGHDGGSVNGYSLGCQVVTLDYAQFRAQIEPLLGLNDRVPYTLVQLSDVYASENLAALG